MRPSSFQQPRLLVLPLLRSSARCLSTYPVVVYWEIPLSKEFVVYWKFPWKFPINLINLFTINNFAMICHLSDTCSIHTTQEFVVERTDTKIVCLRYASEVSCVRPSVLFRWGQRMQCIQWSRWLTWCVHQVAALPSTCQRGLLRLEKEWLLVGDLSSDIFS